MTKIEPLNYTHRKETSAFEDFVFVSDKLNEVIEAYNQQQDILLESLKRIEMIGEMADVLVRSSEMNPIPPSGNSQRLSIAATILAGMLASGNLRDIALEQVVLRAGAYTDELIALIKAGGEK